MLYADKPLKEQSRVRETACVSVGKIRHSGGIETMLLLLHGNAHAAPLCLFNCTPAYVIANAMSSTVRVSAALVYSQAAPAGRRCQRGVVQLLIIMRRNRTERRAVEGW